MSGLCGWIGHGAAEQDLIDRMAAPLARFDGAAIEAVNGARAAVAVAAGDAARHLYVADGLLVALWGHPVAREPALAEVAAAHGLAAALAQQWRHGPEHVCDALAGPFTLCIVDERAGEAVLAIDRMGVQPLTWQLAGEALLFASSADALRVHPLARAAIDAQGLYNYVYFHMVPSPGTIYRGQQRLLPGELLHYRQGRVETRRYWRMAFQENGARSFDDLREEFMDQLKSAVRNATAHGRIGAFLSGGTDSSTIAGILCDVSGNGADTYSIGFEAQGYDEMEYARIASRHFGTRHHEYYVTPDDVAAAIPQVAAICDQPFGNASAVPAFYCARMARADGITRMLGGDGGDELFGGNERYARQHVFALYDRVPRLLRKALLEPAVFNFPGGERVRLLRKARSYIEQASVGMPARLETYNLLSRYGPQQVFTDDFLAGADIGQPLAALARTYGQSEAKSLINRMLALDLKITLADNDLPKVMKACELAGVEVAFPFLDDAMVAFSAGLTPQQKLNGTQLRWFFKKALTGFLPDAIITKQKHGFGLPFGVWLQQHKPLQQLASDSLMDLRKRGIVRGDFIEQLVGQHLAEHAGYHGTMVWVLMMLEQWFRQRNVTL
ncbi:asparagine synthetase B family protein [Pseudoduganella plicata]|uniref:asparagine synthase (glutamine-hydrolyzing) n=1 Tax=Pseudoduganella plicata TaxID=321984 RepID=A0A4P7BGJ6_9BURK|nr:asparagine synthase-related protein [Pseudoduganella plicata]QBQ37352.1 asparagine synthase [Pseudoduganella plicata]GGZ08956.1 asparagine synthetase B [Pseudoduganella plicata]